MNKSDNNQKIIVKKVQIKGNTVLTRSEILPIIKPYIGSKRSLREILINSLAHKALANKVCDALEEASVSFNAVLAQMDADGGTLSDDATYEAYRITDLVGADEISGGQHKATDKQSMRSALSDKELADKIIADLKANQEAVNAMIDSIQAANA